MKAFGVHPLWQPFESRKCESEILFVIVTIIGSMPLLEIIWNVTKMSIAFDFVLFVCRWHLSILYRWLSCICIVIVRWISSEQQTPTQSVFRPIKDFLMSFYRFKTIDIGPIAIFDYTVQFFDCINDSFHYTFFCPKSIDINEILDW